MRYLATCACDKIVIDKLGAHSLISVMSNADISIVPAPGTPEQIPPNAVTPREWWIFSMWEPSSEEAGKEFEQVFQVYWPNKEKLLEGRLGFKPDERVQYTSYSVLGFPVGQQGKVRIVTWVEQQGSRITDIFDYHITVRHIAKAEAEQKPTAGSPAIYQIPAMPRPQ